MKNLFDNFWLLAIVANGFNAAIFWQRSIAYIKEDPTLQQGYITLIRGFFIGMNLPWIVMGIGLKVGGVSQLKDYFYPGNGNIFVVGWWMCLWGLILILNYWIWFRGGAQMLIDHPGLLRGKQQNPQIIKWMSLLLLFVSVFTSIVSFSAKPR
jgi:hypothetical protein